MKILVILSIFAFFSASFATDFFAPLLASDSKTIVSGQYLVVFRENVTTERRTAHIESLKNSLTESDGKVIATWEIGSFGGYSAILSNKFLLRVRQSKDISYVEADQVVTAIDLPKSQACTTQSDATWGINRLSTGATIDLDGIYKYGNQGQSVNAYVIDTGIQITHSDFGGRAVWGANFVDTVNDDCNGHGTHVAGTIGGTIYGVAKKVTMTAVKVLNCFGSGTWTSVIQGIQFAGNAASPSKVVANMSLGGGKSDAVDSAVRAAIAKNVTFAIAAGNSNQDACLYSPAGVLEAITVGATTIDDKGVQEIDLRSSFSNFGKCVDVFAPGELITSAWIGTPTAIRTISGTSMASPHVAGVCALYMDTIVSTPALISAWIVAQSIPGIINLNCVSSPCNISANQLLYSPC